MPDGSPQVSPVWVDVDDGRVLVNTAQGRIKPGNVRRDPRVALAVTRGSDPYTWAQIRGRVVETLREGADDHINRLSHRYRDRDYAFVEGQQRLILVIEPDHVSFRTEG